MDEILRQWEIDLSRTVYLGDGYPWAWVNFGAAFLAALLGAKFEVTENTTWISPKDEQEPKDIRLKYVPNNNKWSRRYLDFCKAASEYLGDRTQISMCTGGIFDVIAGGFRPSEKLMLDLFDYPDEIKRIAREIHDISWKYFEEAYKHLNKHNMGYSSWLPVYSEDPFQVLICDFSYMLSPEMFDEFCKPELEASARKVTHSFFHLDGTLQHLDSLLSIKELDGIQWVPGAGAKPIEEWCDVYKRIRAAGKLIFLGFSDFRQIDRIKEDLGTLEGFLFRSRLSDDYKHLDEIEKKIKEYQ